MKRSKIDGFTVSFEAWSEWQKFSHVDSCYESFNCSELIIVLSDSNSNSGIAFTDGTEWAFFA